MSSPNVQGVPPYRQHQELEQVVASGDHTILSSVIISQSRSRARNDVLADALAISCEKGHHKAAHYLLATENAKPDLPSRNLGRCKGLPPLVLAVKHYHSSSRSGLKAKLPEQTVAPQTMDGLDTIKSLLEHGCALSDHGPDGRNALSHVATIELAELLLAQQSDTERRKALVDVRDKKFENDALMWAIVNKECSDAVVMEYIRQGANRHTVDKAGRTTLMNAAWTGRIPVVELLLQDESIAKKTDNRGRNIWHHIASDTDRSQSDGITDLIFAMDDRDVKVDAKDKQGQTALNLSAMFSTKAVGRQLLEEKSPAIDAIENHEERTALHFAAANGDAEFVAMLLAKGANRFAKCSSGLIPIHLLCACPGDPVDAATFLLSNNARKQLTSLTEEKMTPLHIAAAHGNPGIVNMILQTQDPIDIDALCEGDWTALHLACGRHMAPSQKPSAAYGRSAKQPIVPDRDSTFVNERYLDVVRALLSKGAGVNKKSRLSRTALHIAAEMGHIDIVKLLLEQEDVQFSAKDSRGNTPLLDAAKSNERDKILPLLSPWNERFIRSLPENVKQAAKDYDANVIDFQTAAGTKTQRHKIPIFNVLYRGFSQHGSMTHKNVSTRPDSSEEGAFRWIHLPANNLHWCHTLLTKHFIEGGFSADVESFKALERSLSLQQYRGRRIHSRFMRPACTKLGRRYGDHSHIKSDLSAHDHHIRTFTRVNSTEVTDAKSAPPSPRDHRFFADRDLDGLQPGSGIVDNVRAHDPTSAPIAQEKFITTAPLDEVLEADDASAAVQDCKPSTTAEQAIKASEGTCLFMPYLTLENKLRVSIMHDELPTTSKFHTPSPHSSRRNASRSDNRDARLHHAYSEWDANDYCLHVRRTLDQFWYRNVDTRERDGDQVVQRYQQREQELQGFERESTDVDSLMVDQLWIWILGPSLIVTSFPQDWQQPRHKMPDLLSSILEEIDPRTGTPVQSVYELGACIVGHCLSSCDQSADQNSKPSVLEMFGSSVGEVMNREVMLFRRFKEASVKASQWVKCTLQENIVDGNRQLQDLEDDYFNKVAQNATLHSGRSGSSDDRDRTGTDEPKFVEDLLDIHDETKLLEEVKDIQDELGILLQVVEDQKDVNSKMEKAMKSLLRSEHEPHQLKVGTMLDEQRVLLDQQKSEIENMNQQVKSTYKSITDLLDHKQKHANAIEARYARKQAADTAKAGRTLMVFTIVTVIFLPLSFLAAFFAINLEELPYNGQGKISVGFILKYVLGVGFGTALAFVLLAWHHHRAVRWFKPKWHLCQGWLLRQKTTLLRPFKQRNKAEEETSTTGSSSSSSSSTLRSRGQNVNNDLEKGKKSST